MNTTVYYFTGTGNSLSIANQITNSLEGAELVSMAKSLSLEDFVSRTERVGFVFPLHYYGLPKVVYDFIDKTDFSNSNYFFTVLTRAGGEDGATFIQIDNFLRSKSKKLNAVFAIRMPNNYLIGFELKLHEKIRNRMFKHAKKQIESIVEVVSRNGEELSIYPEVISKKRWEKINLNFLKEVNASDNHFYTIDSCSSCGVCEQVCPVDNIQLVEGKPEWCHRCVQCLACVNYCPEEAILIRTEFMSKTRYQHPDVKVKDLINQK